MARRNIIEIDEEKCTGCGACITGCAEGALAIVNGKARLVSEIYCDGLGACLAECPADALHIVEREAPDFDEAAAMAHVGKAHTEPAHQEAPCACQSSLPQMIKPMAKTAAAGSDQASALQNWPVQLHLAPVKAPSFEKAHLLIAADCAGFCSANLHRDFIAGKTVLIGCPKLDVTEPYVEKLAAILKNNHIESVTVLLMTVPCCFGLAHIVKQAIKASGKTPPLRMVRVNPSGQIEQETLENAAQREKEKTHVDDQMPWPGYGLLETRRHF